MYQIKYCRNCGAELPEDSNYCPGCGMGIHDALESYGRCGVSEKSRLTAFLLCFFLGCFGAHRFYTDRTLSAVLMILTLGGLGIWMFIDMIFIILGEFRDSGGKLLKRWTD